uniref:Retrotrans_gag domain-containing protein n=1 Tax=Glossina austeni TaxID=7395 RepID=A0A1A9UI11_GLOAU
MLQDTALTWFTNNYHRWLEWDVFKRNLLRFFLPKRYFQNLEDEIRKKTQKRREKLNDFVLALKALTRHVGCNEQQKLEKIYNNALPEYLRYRGFWNQEELLGMVDDSESIPAGVAKISQSAKCSNTTMEESGMTQIVESYFVHNGNVKQALHTP